MPHILVTYAVNGYDFNGETYNTITALVKAVTEKNFIKEKCYDGQVKINNLIDFDYSDNFGSKYSNMYTKYTALKGEII